MPEHADLLDRRVSLLRDREDARGPTDRRPRDAGRFASLRRLDRYNAAADPEAVRGDQSPGIDVRQPVQQPGDRGRDQRDHGRIGNICAARPRRAQWVEAAIRDLADRRGHRVGAVVRLPAVVAYRPRARGGGPR